MNDVLISVTSPRFAFSVTVPQHATLERRSEVVDRVMEYLNEARVDLQRAILDREMAARANAAAPTPTPETREP